MQSPKRTATTATKNQVPPVYKEQTPKSNTSAKNSISGNKINLFFFISLGKFVKVKDKINAERTIQNHERVLSIAKLHIKQGIKATP